MAYILIIFILISPSTGWSRQTRESAILVGRVTERGSQSPIENVNIYLATTTRGCWTDTDGVFTLKDVPVGKWDLVISRIGYTRIISHLTIVRSETLSLSFELSDTTISIAEVDVVGVEDEEWEENLESFRRLFLGPSVNSTSCEILNPEVIDLRHVNDTLIAQFRSPLIVQNRALGYSITIVLDQFVWNTRFDYGSYKFYPFYQDLIPSSEAERSTWEENRRQAWNGSLKQFLSSLYLATSEEDGFYIYAGSLKHVVSGHGHRVLSSEFQSDPEPESGYKIISIPGPLRIEYGLQPSKIREPMLARPGRKTNKTGVNLDLSTISILHPRDSVILVDAAGNLFDPLMVEVAGAWGMSRVSELLPNH